MNGLDTNIIVRYLVQDDAVQSQILLIVSLNILPITPNVLTPKRLTAMLSRM
ncbi:MAG: hypothetical protein Q8M99_08655 [Methylotenera sp.]|nr:hypothetical protein [Methylotenera sp.]